MKTRISLNISQLSFAMSCSDGLHHTPSFSSLAGQHNIACATVAKVLTQATPAIKQDILDQVDLNQYTIPVKKDILDADTYESQVVEPFMPIKFDGNLLIEWESFNDTDSLRLNGIYNIVSTSPVLFKEWVIASLPITEIQLPASGMYMINLDAPGQNWALESRPVVIEGLININIKRDMFSTSGEIYKFYPQGTIVSVVSTSLTSITVPGAEIIISRKTMSITDAINLLIAKESVPYYNP